jgi:hypothetical protein
MEIIVKNEETRDQRSVTSDQIRLVAPVRVPGRLSRMV